MLNWPHLVFSPLFLIFCILLIHHFSVAFSSFPLFFPRFIWTAAAQFNWGPASLRGLRPRANQGHCPDVALQPYNAHAAGATPHTAFLPGGHRRPDGVVQRELAWRGEGKIVIKGAEQILLQQKIRRRENITAAIENFHVWQFEHLLYIRVMWNSKAKHVCIT